MNIPLKVESVARDNEMKGVYVLTVIIEGDDG